MKTRNELLDIIENALVNIPLPASPKGLYQPIRYSLESGGKRIRPTLTLAVAQALGADPETAINQAIGVEMYHNFTLLHDDVMDRSEVRRGRPTVHCRWNEQTAILSGDAMLTLATIIVSRGAGERLAEVLELFNDTALLVYEGQQLDMDFETSRSVSVEQYEEMIRLKTSVLLGCACRMGAIMGGGDEDTCRAFYDYGVKLGMAFQLRDDYLDTFGDPAIFGKAIGGDIVNDKKTWLLINAINEDRTGTIDKWLGVNARPADKVAEVTDCYRRLGLEDRCSKLIDRYLDEAVEQLDRVPQLSVEARDFFVSLARKTSNRSN